MKNRHLMGALIALAPVVAFAQVGTTPPAGNASESATTADPAATAPLPETGTTATDPATDPAATTNSVDAGTGETSDPVANNTTTAPDPTAPKPKG